MTLIDGNEVWITAERMYTEKVSRIENEIITSLKEKLKSVQNTKEMLRVFAKFKCDFYFNKNCDAVTDCPLARCSFVQRLTELSTSIKRV